MQAANLAWLAYKNYDLCTVCCKYANFVEQNEQ